jgi:TatD DNase family protein
LIVDAHCHVNLYQENTELALSDIRKNDILAVWNSVDIEDYEKILDVAKDKDYILPGLGIHPNRAHNFSEQNDLIKKRMNEVLFFGEIGLDYFFVREEWKYPLQKELVKLFLEAAGKQNKIVNLHIRNAYNDIMELIESYSVQKVIMHSYDGPKDFFKNYVDREYKFSIGATILEEYKERIPQWKDMQGYTKDLPSDLLLIETDGPPDIQKLPSERLNTIIAKIAKLKKTTPEDIITLSRNNFLDLIKNDNRLAKYTQLLKK